MGRLDNIGKFYVDGLSAKSNKHIFSRFFKTKEQALRMAERMQKQKKIVQANIFHVKNSISDVVVGGIDTSGREHG